MIRKIKLFFILVAAAAMLPSCLNKEPQSAIPESEGMQTFNDAKPPRLSQVMENTQLRPYADNYIKLACKHIIFNQLVELIRHHFPDAVRLSKKYFRHGLAMLLAFIYYNRHGEQIAKMMAEMSLDRIVPDRPYRDYAVGCIHLVEAVYCREEMASICSFVACSPFSSSCLASSIALDIVVLLYFL